MLNKIFKKLFKPKEDNHIRDMVLMNCQRQAVEKAFNEYVKKETENINGLHKM